MKNTQKNIEIERLRPFEGHPCALIENKAKQGTNFNSVFDNLYVPILQSKMPVGYAYEKNGKLYYVNGKDRLCIAEHFENAKGTVAELIENTIRYENKCSEQVNLQY